MDDVFTINKNCCILFIHCKYIVKGAMKLYFMQHSCSVVILFNKGLCISAFSIYLFGKPVVLPFYAFCV